MVRNPELFRDSCVYLLLTPHYTSVLKLLPKKELSMRPMWLRRTLLALLPVIFACVVLLPARDHAAGRPEESASGPTRLLRYADISKDRVVFAYAGDLWIASRQGGDARRLTSHIGDEIFPKFSPDGKWIAFTGEYDGNPDVYVVSAEGGEPKRLTFHPSNDIVLGWTPDGRDILFRADRTGGPPQRTTKLYLVSPQGGPARELPPPRADLTSFSPDGNKIAYIETSQEFRTWKKYRGGWSLPIAIYDLKKNTYEELPKTNGMDLFPMWHGNAIYFISDRDGVMNLYSYDLSSKQPKSLPTTRNTISSGPALDLMPSSMKMGACSTNTLSIPAKRAIFPSQCAPRTWKPARSSKTSPRILMPLRFRRPACALWSKRAAAFSLSPPSMAAFAR